MDSFLTRFRNPLVLIGIVLVQVIALAMQVQRPKAGFDVNGQEESSRITLLRRWTISVVTPFERVTHGSSLKARNFWTNYINLRHVKEQDTSLKEEIARLRQEQAAFSEDAAQGRRLQTLLDFKQKYIAQTVAAQVIGTSGTDRSRVVYLDKGYEEGLRTEQAVMTPDGVVGKIRDVFPHSAQLLLLNDPTSGAGVILAAARIRGILRGTTNGLIQISNLTADSRIKVGDEVVTSGGDLVFPRGIPVGTIQSIAPDPQHQPYSAIVVKPMANLSRLEEVLVITQTQSSLPLLAQQDAAIAEGTATAQAAQAAAEREKQRAADLLADKLPSLHDETPEGKPGDPASGTPAQINPAASDIGGLPGIPNSGMPHTKNTLHTDRYSPNAAPAAETLQPGGGEPKPEEPPR